MKYKVFFMATTISSFNKDTQPLASRETWITPEEQLKRLLPIDEIATAVPALALDVVTIIAKYAASDANLINWHEFLIKLKVFPAKLPALSEKIIEIFKEICPIYGGQKKDDGSFYTVGDTHTLTLISRELGTLNRFEYGILRPYAEAHFPKGENPFQCRYEMNISLEHGDRAFGPTRWELHTAVLPETFNQSYEQQVMSIESLSKKALVNYQIPSLHGSIAAFFHRKVATDFYQAGDEAQQFTRVKDRYNGRHQLLVTCSASKELRVRPSFFPCEGSVGITAVCMLEDN
jgi:hypothetical protein